MKKTNLLWLSIAAMALMVSSNAFASLVNGTTAPVDATKSTAAATEKTIKHHAQGEHKRMHHAKVKTEDAAKDLIKKTT